MFISLNDSPSRIGLSTTYVFVSFIYVYIIILFFYYYYLKKLIFTLGQWITIETFVQSNVKYSPHLKYCRIMHFNFYLFVTCMKVWPAFL